MDGSSGRLRATPRLRDFRHLGAACFVGALALTMALTALLLSLVTAPVALAAPQVQVSGGTLSITSTDDQPVSALMSSDAPFLGPGYAPPIASVFGPPPGFSTPSDWFAYGPRFLWHGTAPVAGAGCHAVPRGVEAAHVECPDAVYQIDIALAGGDDYLSVASSNAPVRLSGGAGDDGLRLDARAAATLDGGPGNDSLRLEGAGTVHGGPGDDYISLETRGAVADCGPGDDVVADNYFYLSGPATVDEATCGPVLRPVRSCQRHPSPVRSHTPTRSSHATAVSRSRRRSGPRRRAGGRLCSNVRDPSRAQAFRVRERDGQRAASAAGSVCVRGGTCAPRSRSSPASLAA